MHARRRCLGGQYLCYARRPFRVGKPLYRMRFHCARWDDRRLFIQAAIGLGKVAQEQGRFELALQRYCEALHSAELGKFATLIAVTLNNMGGIAARQADYETARTCYERGLAIRREHGDIWGIANTLRNLGYASQAQDDPHSACAYPGRRSP